MTFSRLVSELTDTSRMTCSGCCYCSGENIGRLRLLIKFKMCKQ